MRDPAGQAAAPEARAAALRAGCEALFRLALGGDRATIGEAHGDYGVALNKLAGVVEAQGRPEEAKALHAEALAIFRETFDDLHTSTQKVVRNLRALIVPLLPGSIHRPGGEPPWAAGQDGAPGLVAGA